MRNLDDFKLLFEFFNFYGMDATAIPGLSVSTWNDFLAMAKEQKRQFEIDRKQADKEDAENEETEEERKVREQKEHNDVLYHSVQG